MIVDGDLAPEAHVEEIKVSEQFGISRTPLREALIALEQEGLVRSRPRKGFIVVAPDEALVRESFPIMSALECAAVKLGGERLAANAQQLRALNRDLATERSKPRQYELDRQFHAALTEACGNARLLSLLEMERARLRLIDGSHRRGMANLDGSVAEHEQIIGDIERRDFELAAQKLAAHWEHGVEVVAAWMRDIERENR
jgi:DNA-binding GntR family transcriptional regulator